MLMADTMSIFFVVLGIMLAFSGLWLMCRGLWPDAVAAPMALADGCSFVTGALPLHTLTNIEIMKKFLEVDIAVTESANDNWLVEVRA